MKSEVSSSAFSGGLRGGYSSPLEDEIAADLIREYGIDAAESANPPPIDDGTKAEEDQKPTIPAFKKRKKNANRQQRQTKIRT